MCVSLFVSLSFSMFVYSCYCWWVLPLIAWKNFIVQAIWKNVQIEFFASHFTTCHMSLCARFTRAPLHYIALLNRTWWTTLSQEAYTLYLMHVFFCFPVCLSVCLSGCQSVCSFVFLFVRVLVLVYICVLILYYIMYKLYIFE